MYKETAVPETDYVPEKEQCQRPPSSPAFLKYLQLKVILIFQQKDSLRGHVISYFKAGGHKEMSLLLIAPSYMSPNAGGGGEVTGSQIISR